MKDSDAMRAVMNLLDMGDDLDRDGDAAAAIIARVGAGILSGLDTINSTLEEIRDAIKEK